MSGRLIVIAAKSPQAGRVKTRLVGGDVTPAMAAAFASAFLTDTVRIAGAPVLDAELLLALDGAAEYLPRDVRRVRRIRQRGNSLGERLVHIFGEAFAAGHSLVCVLGSDTPHLPVAFVQEAFGRLGRDADAVFAPADDGGYCLVALGKPLPELFAGIPWSSNGVLEETLKAATAAGIKTALLPGWYDVDSAGDLRRLHTDLRRGTVAAPATAALLDARTAGARANTGTITQRENLRI
jgi:rSAM/selenodomain-associated transferase 1